MGRSGKRERELAGALLGAAGEALAETLWPTRCAVCDTPGRVLCERCERALAYVDAWRACPRCGAPFGLVQCTECAPSSLARLGRGAWPFDACASATAFDAETGRIVRVYKDQGERRLADAMGAIMARIVPRSWDFDAVSFVPASEAAARRRGFDHGELLARSVAEALGAPCRPLLARPASRDQRRLTRAQRLANLQGRFAVLPGAFVPRRVMLVDDVLTTGATLCDAADALKAAGAAEVRCLTFARVM